ncbi:MAG: hypothetical protein ACFB51_20510, partial [Anaerolineae bacterium]
VAAVALLGGGRATALNAASPEITHPDGLLLRIEEGSARVRVETVPRELFVSEQAGRQWTAAYSVLPARLEPLSPIYEVTTRGDGSLTGLMAIPNGAEPLALVDLYAWQDGEWQFVPSTVDAATGSIVFDASQNLAVMAVRTQPEAAEAAEVIPANGGQTDADYGLAMPRGVTVDGSGQLNGTPVEASGTRITPVVTNRALVSYEGVDNLHDALVALAAGYNGLVLDFSPGSGYAACVAALAEDLAAESKTLGVIVYADSMNSYDLAALGRTTDRVWLAPGADPAVYASGEALDTLVAHVERSRTGLLVSAYTVDLSDTGAQPLTFEEASALFGEVTAIEGYLTPGAPVPVNADFAVRLQGEVESMGFDPALGMNYLTYSDNEGSHIVYFSSAQALQQRLEWARAYGLGAVAVEGAGAPYAAPTVINGLNAFLTGGEVEGPTPISLVWNVSTGDGTVVAEQSGDLTLMQVIWQVFSDTGTYEIAARVQTGDQQTAIGSLTLDVAGSVPEPAEPEEEDEAGDEQAELPPEEVEEPTEQPTPAPPTGTIAAGEFELGGQTHSFANPDLMAATGMTWVKFQHKWSPADPPSAVAGRINDARARGFKVLLSIPGPLYPDSIDYAAYTQFLAGVAALGPDAIEVWNEMNFDREWPADQISGESYVTNMLAPAYEAIKAANPNVLVIAGAPTPTGAFPGGCSTITVGDSTITGCNDDVYVDQMAAAGAANYMDCMGVHNNEGIIPPSQRTGDPRDEYPTRYFYGMISRYDKFGKPLCFTELGYLSGEGFDSLPSAFGWASNTTVQQQAAWLAEAAVLSSQSGRVRMMIIFNVDFQVYGADPQAGYAMIRPDGSCPACDALAAVAP